MTQCAPHQRWIFACGHNQDRQGGKRRTQVNQRRKSMCARHIEVKQHQLGLLVALGQLTQIVDGVRLQQLRIRQDLRHCAPQGIAEQRMVVGNQNLTHEWLGVRTGRMIPARLPEQPARVHACVLRVHGACVTSENAHGPDSRPRWDRPRSRCHPTGLARSRRSCAGCGA
jgi:hypothetical protein